MIIALTTKIITIAIVIYANLCDLNFKTNILIFVLGSTLLYCFWVLT